METSLTEEMGPFDVKKIRIKNKLSEISDLKLRRTYKVGRHLLNQNINKVVKTE